uniref:O-methyltransferase n=1 Tax=Hirondellea gigas TaxID=1518452 RepID=A0A2P2HVP1_9CRUS
MPAGGKSYITSDKTVKYAAEHSLRETAIQKELQQVTMQHKRHTMMGAPECLQLTANLIKSIRAKKVLDIGVFTGCSALSAALALPDDGEVHGLDVSEDYVNIGRPYFEKSGVANKIKIHIGPGLDTLNKFLDDGQAGTFDFAFIDADKDNYINYYEKCLVLLRKGGIIAVDNTIWGGTVMDESDTSLDTTSIRAFNELVKDDQRVDISFLTIGDGLTLLFIK